MSHGSGRDATETDARPVGSTSVEPPARPRGRVVAAICDVVGRDPGVCSGPLTTAVIRRGVSRSRHSVQVQVAELVGAGVLVARPLHPDARVRRYWLAAAAPAADAPEPVDALAARLWAAAAVAYRLSAAVSWYTHGEDCPARERDDALDADERSHANCDGQAACDDACAGRPLECECGLDGLWRDLGALRAALVGDADPAADAPFDALRAGASGPDVPTTISQRGGR